MRKKRIRKAMLVLFFCLSLLLTQSNLIESNTAYAAEIIVDNGDAGYSETGRWLTSGLAGCYGATSRYSATGTGADYVTWTPTISTAGQYDVYMYFPEHENRGIDVPVTIYHNGSATQYFVNQTMNGSQWQYLGAHYFAAGTSGYVKLTDGNDDGDYVGADAVKFVSSSQPLASGYKEIDWYYRDIQILFDGDTQQTQQYLGFPSTIKMSDTEVLTAYKRGDAHYLDDGDTELIKFNPTTQTVTSRTMIHNSTYNDQNSELMEMPNGDLVIYIDKQTASSPIDRFGLVELRSTDGGTNWTDNGLVPLIGGVRYAYCLDSHIEGSDVYILCMTFPYIEDSGPRAVHVLKSTDSGSSWTHIKNLTAEFSYKFNECTFEKYGSGYIVVGRADSYDYGARIFRTDSSFNVIQSRNLTDDYACLYSCQRPKLFQKDGLYHLIGRNRKPNDYSTLQYYLMDPETLEIRTYSELYGTIGSEQADSHYVEEYFLESGGTEHFNVINYAPHSGDNPDIVRYDFDWEEFEPFLVEDFNIMTTGNPPTGWSVTTSGGTVTVANTPSASDKSMRLYDTSGVNLVDAEKSISSQNGVTVAEFEVRLSQNNQTFAANLRDSWDTQAVTVIFSDTGYIQAYQGSTKTNLRTYSSNTWYKVKIIADPSTDKFDLYVDGVQEVDNQSFRYNVSNIGNIRFNSIGTSTGTMYADDVMLY